MCLSGGDRQGRWCQPLVALVRNSTGDLPTTPVRAIALLAAECPSIKRETMETNAVEHLWPLVLHGHGVQKVEAVALGHLAANNHSNQDVIGSSGAIADLVHLVSTGTGSEKLAACVALGQLAMDNEKNAVMMASLGLLEELVIFLRKASIGHQRHSVLSALWVVTQPHQNLCAFSRLYTSVLIAVSDSASDDIEKQLVSKLLYRLTTLSNAPNTAYVGLRPTSLVGSIGAYTSIPDLLRILRSTPDGDDQLTTALRWLYHHTYNFETHNPILENDGATSHVEVALHDGSTYDQCLYAHGCLAQLPLEPSVRTFVVDHLREPTYAELERLCIAAAPPRPYDARAEAIELLGCLELVRPEDYGITDFAKWIVDGLKWKTSSRLVIAAARTITVLVRQLPLCGNIVLEHNVLPLLVDHVLHGCDFVKATVADALGAIAGIDSASQSRVLDANAVTPLVRLVHVGPRQGKICAVVALTQLMRDSAEAQKLIAHAGVIGPLFDLLPSPNEIDASYGARSFQSLCANGESGAVALQSALQSIGAVEPFGMLLIRLLWKATASSTQLQVAHTLRTLSSKASLKTEVVQFGVREAMCELGSSTKDPAIRMVADETVACLL